MYLSSTNINLYFFFVTDEKKKYVKCHKGRHIAYQENDFGPKTALGACKCRKCYQLMQLQKKKDSRYAG